MSLLCVTSEQIYTHVYIYIYTYDSVLLPSVEKKSNIGDGVS